MAESETKYCLCPAFGNCWWLSSPNICEYLSEWIFQVVERRDSFLNGCTWRLSVSILAFIKKKKKKIEVKMLIMKIPCFV